jgi:3-dehydroquinate synthase
MVMASTLSARLKLIPHSYAQRIQRLVELAGLPVKGPDVGEDRFLELMRLDKKSEAGDIRFVVIAAPGHAIVQGAPDALVREVIAAHTG